MAAVSMLHPMKPSTSIPAAPLPEPLLFELDHGDKAGVDLPPVPAHSRRLGTMQRTSSLDLPNISEPQVVRHYTRLSQLNFCIDTNFYPLGSCTMKHNPRLNEKMARLSGFAAIHPLQPESTAQGALALMHELSHWLMTFTGLPSVTLSPAAGAHGELCGIMTIKAALEARGEKRHLVLVPESAHGTNPATAAACGFTVATIPANAQGRVDLDALKAALNNDVAAVMITNPNTCGLFEPDMKAIADAVHAVGGFVYCDGANFNAIAGRVRPADLGIDCMHINLHKTFSTPHGGGGPGSGPVVFCAELAKYAPLPRVEKQGDHYHLIEEDSNSLGRIKAFSGQFGTFVRALSYMLSLGSDGIWQASTDAVLNANYIRASLNEVYNVAFPGICMHEVLLDDRALKDTGVTTLDIAKALLDYGIHPMTMYFPLVVGGAMLIEPTESESKETLDRFIAIMRELLQKAQTGDVAYFKGAPYNTPMRRLDETAAARKPLLRWASIAPA